MLKAEINIRYHQWSPRTEKQHRKRTVEAFEQSGLTNHSRTAMTLPFIIAHCEENKIPYKLTA